MARSRSVNGNALEALVGAVYLDLGYKAARKFVLRGLIKPFVDVNKLTTTTSNYKSKLIEWAQRHHDIVARFGRFPHRNAMLGRENTAEEVAFLLTPGSGF